MNRLQQELQRLYGPQAGAGPGLGPDVGAWVDAQGQVRAMVLELARPARWALLSAVWAGVQADLGLPAPAIAVNGRDGCQLWFSLSAPVPAHQAAALLDALRRRYLADIAPARLAQWPALAATPGAPPPLQPQPLPALRPDTGQWSSFVAADLVPMFDDEPWLDVPPNADGQAQLLASLKRIPPAEFEAAWQQLSPATPPAAAEPACRAPAPASPTLDPRRFLLAAMNDDRLDMALRIEAAKALLPCIEPASDSRRERDGDPLA